MGFFRILSVIMALSFVLGFLAGTVVMLPVGIDIENPLAGVRAAERASPHNWVAEQDILVYDDKVVFYVDDPYWSKFLDTNSMDPLIDEGSNAIQIKPQSTADIHVGDVISFRSGDGVIIHRVASIGVDDKGWYAVTRGDNNAYADPVRVRFESVERVLIAVIY